MGHQQVVHTYVSSLLNVEYPTALRRSYVQPISTPSEAIPTLDIKITSHSQVPSKAPCSKKCTRDHKITSINVPQNNRAAR